MQHFLRRLANGQRVLAFETKENSSTAWGVSNPCLRNEVFLSPSSRIPGFFRRLNSSGERRKNSRS